MDTIVAFIVGIIHWFAGMYSVVLSVSDAFPQPLGLLLLVLFGLSCYALSYKLGNSQEEVRVLKMLNAELQRKLKERSDLDSEKTEMSKTPKRNYKKLLSLRSHTKLDKFLNKLRINKGSV